MVRKAKLIFNDAAVLSFVDGAGENVRPKRSDGPFDGLGLHLHFQRLAKQDDVVALRQPGCPVCHVIPRPDEE